MVANPAKTTLHGGQSRSCSADREQRTKEKSLAAYPPPPPLPTLLVRRKNKIKTTQRIYRRYAGLGLSRLRTRIPLTRGLGQKSCFAKFYASVCDYKFPSLVAFLFSWRCLAASTSYFLHTTMNLRPPSVAVSTHTSALNAVAFQSSAIPNARMSLCTQSVHSFSFHPVLSALHLQGLNTICFFGSRPPLIRMSVLAHKSLLVRNVVSMLSHTVISKARLYEVIRWSGLFVLHTYINRHFFKKNMNASRPPSEHPPVRGEMSKRLGGIVGYKDKTSSLDLNGFPYGSNIGSTV